MAAAGTSRGQEDGPPYPRGLRRAPLKNAAGAVRKTKEKDLRAELTREGVPGLTVTLGNQRSKT